MARSNTHYYNLCTWTEGDRYPHRHREGECYGEAVFYGRRGKVVRRSRFPQWTPQYCRHGPPMRIKRMWVRRARAKQQREMLRSPEDPVVTPMRWLINLWDWY